MLTFARAAGLAATVILIAAQPSEAQDSSLRLSIAGGPHAGTYELARGQCDAMGSSIMSMFTPKLSGQSAGQNGLESIEVYTEPGKGKPDGLAVRAAFRPKSGKRVIYEIYAIPPELQAPGSKSPAKGSGTVTVQRGQDGTSASFRGKTADAVRMEGTVKCGKP